MQQRVVEGVLLRLVKLSQPVDVEVRELCAHLLVLEAFGREVSFLLLENVLDVGQVCVFLRDVLPGVLVPDVLPLHLLVLDCLGLSLTRQPALH